MCQGERYRNQCSGATLNRICSLHSCSGSICCFYCNAIEACEAILCVYAKIMFYAEYAG